jgi:hypothetical protein
MRDSTPKRGLAEIRAMKKIIPPSVYEGEPDPFNSLGLRKGLRSQIVGLADEAGMTVRDFVLDALKAKGLKVRRSDRTPRK